MKKILKIGARRSYRSYGHRTGPLLHCTTDHIMFPNPYGIRTGLYYTRRDLTEPVWYTYGFTLFCGHKADITSRTHMTTALQECDFVRTFHEPQIPTFPQVYGPETTGRSHVIVALDVLCLGHMKFQGSSGPRR